MSKGILHNKKLLPALGGCGVLAVVAAAIFWFQWDARQMHRLSLPPGASDALREGFRKNAMTSASCRSCHEEIFAQWDLSHHSKANRVLSANKDRSAFVPGHSLMSAGLETHMFWKTDQPSISTPLADGVVRTFHPDMVLAYTPMQQFLVPFGDGRWQVTEWAWDPARKDWFNVYGSEGRHPREWGSWAGRGMNWNSNCATCHMTGFEKGYLIPTDSYASRWDEMGVSCLQCHAVTEEHLRKPKEPLARYNWAVHQDTCAACHSRREEIYPGFGPGSNYDDHYRIALPVRHGLYYPDGQVLDEDFEYGSFLMSKMGGRAGVTCLDCHNAHSGANKLPVADNVNCLFCHAPPGQRGAPALEATAHSHHAAGSTGNKCVECHMTWTTYMQRDPRRDHGFIIPDPLLTKELGIPNACNKCHADKSVDWAIEWTDRWYGDKMKRPERERTRAVARAYAGDSGKELTDELLRLAEREDISMWRAALLSMASRRVDLPAVRNALTSALKDPSPIVRAASIDGLAPLPAEARTEIAALLDDPIRLVRLRAAWARRDMLPTGGDVKRELIQSLEFNADQPSGAASMGQWYYAQHDLRQAEAWYRKAISWDRFSPPLFADLALMQNASQQSTQAVQTLDEGLQSSPSNPELLGMKALLLAELGDSNGAAAAFEKTLSVDPNQPRTWYNLGLLYAQKERLADAVEALKKAEEFDKESADYPYARATIHLRQGDRAAAREAAHRALEINPGFTPASTLLQSIGDH